MPEKINWFAQKCCVSQGKEDASLIYRDNSHWILILYINGCTEREFFISYFGTYTFYWALWDIWQYETPMLMKYTKIVDEMGP